MSEKEQKHIPVLLQEVIEGLNLQPGMNIIDGTVGGGGHAEAILELTGPDGVLIGFDRDADALAQASKRLKRFGDRFIPVHDSYASIARESDGSPSVHQELLSRYPIHGILVDLGLSSMQMDSEERGFAFRLDSPLDMRFDAREDVTAADILNTWPEEELRRIFKTYAEESAAGRLARAIVQERDAGESFARTTDFVRVIERVIPRYTRKRHAAAPLFQALRIAVNKELEQLERFLPASVKCLSTGGRLAVISFHSIEDRMTKRFMKEQTVDCTCPPEFPVCRCTTVPTLKLITRKPIAPTEEEVDKNQRSRSAKLRLAEKIESSK